MLHGSSSPGLAGSELSRLLARLGAGAADVPPAGARPALAERLGHWLGWSGAIALSAALEPVAPGAPAGRADLADLADDSERAAADLRRVRAALQVGLAAGARDTAASPTDFGPYRHHCRLQQQAMQDAVAALRQRLRQLLARRSAEGARLAAIDAVMDQSLAAQERALLGLVPLRLQAHFDRLRQAARSEAGEAGDAGDPSRWLAAFCADMQHLLQAELEHRLLPAQGLLDSLRNPTPT